MVWRKRIQLQGLYWRNTWKDGYYLMSKYLETYIKSNKVQMEKEAFDFLVTDLLAKNLRGNDKQRTLTAHNMEDILKNQFDNRDH